jgi:indolepyruvate ferredoxin oxidoreductase, beta subunit
MKTDMILAGVGGQGILSIAAVIGYAALAEGLNLKQAEVHGMAQRGGDVQSHLRIADGPIHSDLVAFGGADIILSVEPLESLRYLPYLKPSGWLVTNVTPVKNIAYPEMEEILARLDALPRRLVLDADTLAAESGNRRGMNMVMAGAAAPFLGFSFERLEEGVRKVFEAKGPEVVAANLKALSAGRDFAESILESSGGPRASRGSAQAGTAAGTTAGAP